MTWLALSSGGRAAGGNGDLSLLARPSRTMSFSLLCSSSRPSGALYIANITLNLEHSFLQCVALLAHSMGVHVSKMEVSSVPVTVCSVYGSRSWESCLKQEKPPSSPTLVVSFNPPPCEFPRRSAAVLWSVFAQRPNEWHGRLNTRSCESLHWASAVISPMFCRQAHVRCKLHHFRGLEPLLGRKSFR